MPRRSANVRNAILFCIIKGFVYFHKRDYEKAIETIDSIDTEQFALMESIIIEKIKAKAR